MKNRRSINRLLLGILLGLVILALVLRVVVPALINEDEIRAKIEEGLEKSTSLEFAITELALEPTMFRGIRVHLNTTKILDDEATEPLATVEDIVVTLRYWPLIRHRVPEIAQVELKDIHVFIREHSIFSEIDLKPVEQEPGFLQPAELKNARIVLKNYILHDFEVPDATRKIMPKAREFVMAGDTLVISHLYSSKPIAVNAKGIMNFLTEPVDGRRRAVPYGRYDISLALPADFIPEREDKGGESAAKVDFKRLPEDLKLQLKLSRHDPIALSLRYEKTKGTIKTQNGPLDLLQAQALYYQVSDMFLLPVPKQVAQVYLTGKIIADGRFDLAFKNGTLQDWDYRGVLELIDVMLARAIPQLSIPLRGVRGKIHFEEDRIRFPDLRLMLGQVPLRLEGFYLKKREALEARILADNVRLRELEQTLQRAGIALGELEGMDVRGLLDVNLKVAGPVRQLRYSGNVDVAQGYFADPSLGLTLQQFVADLRLNGRLGENVPVPSVQGEIRIAQGQYQNEPQGVFVDRFTGTIQFNPNTQGVLGDLTVPGYGGVLNIQQGRYVDPDPSRELVVQDIKGELKLGSPLQVANFTGVLAGETFSVNGTIARNLKDLQLSLTGQNINVPRFREQVISQFPQFDELFATLQPYEGIADVNLALSGAPTDPNISGRIDLQQLAFATGPDYPLTIPTLTIFLEGDNVRIPQTTVNLGDIALNLEGSFQQGGQYRFRFNSETVPMAFIRDNALLLAMFTGQELPEIWNTAGSFMLDGLIANNSQNVTVQFNDAGLSWRGADFPLYGLQGAVQYTQAGSGPPRIETENFRFRYGNSPVRLEASYQQQLALEVEGVMSRLLVNHFLTSPTATVAPYEAVPFQVEASGSLAGLTGGPGRNDATASLFLNLAGLVADRALGDNEVMPRLNPEAVDVVASNQVRQEPDSYLTAQLSLLGETLRLDQGILQLMDSGRLVAEGVVENLFNPDAIAYAGEVVTVPELQLESLGEKNGNGEGLFHGIQGGIATNMNFQGGIDGITAMDGWLEITGLQWPALTLQDLTARLALNGYAGTLDVPSLNIPGVSVSARANIEDVSARPMTLTDVSINGNQISVASLTEFNQEVLGGVVTEQLLQPFRSPRQEGDPALFFQFRDGAVTANEVIYQNILMENFQSRLSVFANGFFEMEDTSLEAAGGKATGYLSMNPQADNFTTLALDVEDVSANALTRALLGVTGQIFGNVDGTIRFTTSGATDEETLGNANGTVEFRVTDGRLPAISRVETLLAAANVVRGGVLNLNLGNIFRTLAPLNTNYFAEMSGDLLIAEKVLYTDNVVSDGENLDLLIQGSIQMDNGYANLLVNGQMSQDVSGALGELGKLSLQSVIRYVPGLGYLPGGEDGERRSGLLGWIPGVGYIPGFGGPAGEYNRFQVRLVGPLDTPGAIEDFRWVRSGGI